MKTNYILLILLILVMSSYQQISFVGNPTSLVAFVSETTVIVLDGNTNSHNGESCVASFEIHHSSPSKPTWLSNSMFTLQFTPAVVGDAGVYVLRYLVIETGIGP
jgi:hypothetical protein